MAGIKEVAAKAGLSVATVSRALSGKTNVSARARRLAQEAAQELGFVPSYHASSLASGRNHNIGLDDMREERGCRKAGHRSF